MSCEHDCVKPPRFPAVIHNRPALPRIGYRVGEYPQLRAHMLARLDQDRRLSAWTHRAADDPGIAILEATAVAGDILTFYQSLYANEAFLRTAEWRESVGALVRLLGYRLAPGVGGEATFALAVDSDGPVTVPAGFGFKAQLEGQDQPAEFESTAEVTAYPALGRFNLYRPRPALQPIHDGETRLEIHRVDGASDYASLTGVELRQGDRLMLVPDTALWDEGGGAYAGPQKKPEILIVQEVETVLDRVTITFEGALTVDRDDLVRAYKIDRSFRHFGHNAPRSVGSVDETTGFYTSSPTEFDREIGQDSSEADFYSAVAEEEMPLDTEVDDLAVGSDLICEGFLRFTGSGSELRFTVVREIRDLRSDTFTWGGLTGSVSVLTLETGLIANAGIADATADVRRLRFHETVGPELVLRAPRVPADGPFALGEKLYFFGTWDDVRGLAQRQLLLEGSDGTVQQVQVTDQLEDFSLAGRDEENPWMWPLSLDQLPELDREAFDESDPRVTVYGNLVATDQGKTEAEAVLGSGDARQAFQTFALPKTPLTYLLDETRTPARAPELEIRVDCILWQQVDNFFSSVESDQVYVVREGDDGASWVQFGDGKTGSRLPSGKNNVVALYRTGVGAAGALETGVKPSATGKLKEVKEVFLPGPAVGGGEPESADGARQAAPASLQSLGRLVSLTDFEAEARALPGVTKARADWTAPDGTALVRMTVLTDTGGSAAVDKIRDTLLAYNRCRGPARFPIVVVEGALQYVYLKLLAGYEASRRAADVDAAIREALGTSGGDGLFSLRRRGFGQDAHVSQVIGAVQRVDGVRWVTVKAALPIPLGDPPETDPAELAAPVPAALEKTLRCEADRVLALDDSHLVLNLATDDTARGCAA